MEGHLQSGAKNGFETLSYFSNNQSALHSRCIPEQKDEMVRVYGVFELLSVEHEQHRVGDGEREDRKAECADERSARGVEVGHAIALTREPLLDAQRGLQLFGARQRLQVQTNY